MATDRIIEHVERLRQRPEEERHKIAFGVATGLTAIVAIGWATALATSGTLALNSAPTEERTPEDELSESLTRSGAAFSELMGAAGAAFKGDGEAALRIIDSRTSSTLTEDPVSTSNETVISF